MDYFSCCYRCLTQLFVSIFFLSFVSHLSSMELNMAYIGFWGSFRSRFHGAPHTSSFEAVVHACCSSLPFPAYLPAYQTAISIYWPFCFASNWWPLLTIEGTHRFNPLPCSWTLLKNPLSYSLAWLLVAQGPWENENMLQSNGWVERLLCSIGRKLHVILIFHWLWPE